MTEKGNKAVSWRTEASSSSCSRHHCPWPRSRAFEGFRCRGDHQVSAPAMVLLKCSSGIYRGWRQ